MFVDALIVKERTDRSKGIQRAKGQKTRVQNWKENERTRENDMDTFRVHRGVYSSMLLSQRSARIARKVFNVQRVRERAFKIEKRTMYRKLETICRWDPIWRSHRVGWGKKRGWAFTRKVARKIPRHLNKEGHRLDESSCFTSSRIKRTDVLSATRI